jgi:hypothetical protein
MCTVAVYGPAAQERLHTALNRWPLRHRKDTKKSLIRHTFSGRSPYAGHDMRGAFVVRLGPGTRPSENHFEGWAEEVDSGKEVKFHSLDQLVKFFSERFQMGFTSDRNLDRDNP